MRPASFDASNNQYWPDNDAITFPDPDGREFVFAPWIFGEAPPLATGGDRVAASMRGPDGA